MNIDSLMRRRRCTADCRSCYSQIWHTSIDSQASYRRRLRFVPSTPAFDTSVRGGGRYQTIVMAVDMEQLEWFGYPMLKKYSSILYRFSVI